MAIESDPWQGEESSLLEPGRVNETDIKQDLLTWLQSWLHGRDRKVQFQELWVSFSGAHRLKIALF